VFAALTLLALSCRDNTNTKATPKPAASTDSVATNPDRIFALSLKAGSPRKEALPIPTPSPSPTPEVFPTPARTEPSEQIALPIDGTVTAARDDGQTIEGVWITFYDCNVEGYCVATASGINLTKGGRYADCDPDYWPFGTRMTIVSDPHQYEWACVDTGSAVLGQKHWDVWFYDQSDGETYLDEIGGTIVTIRVLPR